MLLKQILGRQERFVFSQANHFKKSLSTINKMQAQAPLLETVQSRPDKLADYTTVWTEMKDLQVKYNCLSLGEGATNVQTPDFLINAMTQAMRDGHNQYNRSFGVAPLVNKLAQVYGPRLGKELNPMKDILVTLGANGALSSYVNAYSNSNDTVVAFEPMFPMYIDHGEFSGGNI